MKKRFKVGDHVTWNSEAGRVSGRIIKVHTQDVDYKGHTHHANPDEPQYEIKSDKTDHIAMHKGSALKRAESEPFMTSDLELCSDAPAKPVGQPIAKADLRGKAAY